MSKRYRCVRSEGAAFVVGNIYTVDDKGEICGELSSHFYPIECKTAVEWLEKHCDYKFEEVTDMFTLDDLKTGMIVKLRDNSIGVVMRGMNVTDGGVVVERDAIVGLNSSWALVMQDYCTDLKHKQSDNDIMLVARAHVYPNLNYADREFNLSSNILYDRSKVEERKRMTVEEIEKLLGYKVAIVDTEGK